MWLTSQYFDKIDNVILGSTCSLTFTGCQTFISLNIVQLVDFKQDFIGTRIEHESKMSQELYFKSNTEHHADRDSWYKIY